VTTPGIQTADTRAATPITAGAPTSTAPTTDGGNAPGGPAPAANDAPPALLANGDNVGIQANTDKTPPSSFAATLASTTPSHGDKAISAKDDASQSNAASNNGPDVQPAATPAPAPAQSPTPNADQLANGVVTAPHAASAPAPVSVAVHVAPQEQSPAPNVNSLAIEIAAKSQGGAKQFDIRLDPPELGRIEVRLSIDATGKAQAHMTVDQPQTLDLMQKDSSSLTRALRDAGLDVSQNGLNFSLKGQDRNGDGGSGNTQPRTPSLTLAATRTIDAAQSSTSYLSSAGDARLDIHV